VHIFEKYAKIGEIRKVNDCLPAVPADNSYFTCPIIVTPLGTARYRFMFETSAFRYRVTPYGVRYTDPVRNEFAAGHARKQQFIATSFLS
jgi:hypothetical protein